MNKVLSVRLRKLARMMPNKDYYEKGDQDD